MNKLKYCILTLIFLSCNIKNDTHDNEDNFSSRTYKLDSCGKFYFDKKLGLNIYTYLPVMPSLPNDATLMEYMTNKIAFDYKDSKIKLRIIINKDGSILSFKIFTNGSDKMRLIHTNDLNMPNWNPGLCDSIPKVVELTEIIRLNPR